MTPEEIRKYIRSSYTDEYAERLAAKTEEIVPEGYEVPPTTLIHLCLQAIMEEQYRTADRSPGWPSLEHDALRVILKKRIEGTT